LSLQYFYFKVIEKEKQAIKDLSIPTIKLTNDLPTVATAVEKRS